MHKGLLFVVSAPAGCGKDTILEQVLAQTENVGYSVSATTRAPRPGEVDGTHYHFLTRERFEQMISEGAVLEYTEYCGNFYGTPRKEAEEVLDSGKHLILEIEVDGAMQVKKRYPEAVLIMLLPPSYEVQEQRLRGRATETEDKIRARLEQTKFEVRRLPDYDYVVYNNDGCAIDCAREIQTIVRAESHATKRVPTAASDYFRKKND